MTQTVLITGDRALRPAPAFEIVQAVLTVLLNQTGGDVEVHTGDALMGVERAVRYMLPEPLVQIHKYSMNSEGQIDFDAFMKDLSGKVDRVLVVHTDPLNSKVTKAVMQHFDESKVEFPLDLILNKAPATTEDMEAELQALMDEPPTDPEV